MQRFPGLRIAAVVVSLSLMIPLPSPVEASSYVVGAGDKLFVDFPLRGSPADLQPLGGNGLTLVIVGEKVFFRYEVTVAPDGYISLPTMNPVRVDGLTLEQVRDSVASHLPSFSLRDTVSVIMASSNSEAFVVTGEVQHPGRFIYERPTTLIEALAMAGGATDHAELEKVQLFRAGAKAQTFDFSYKSLSEHGPAQVTLLPSDSVVVPRRWFTPDSYFVLIVLSMITTAATVYVATK